MQMMHPQTRSDLTYVLTMLRDKGEDETFRFLRAARKNSAPIQQINMEDSK